MTLEIKGKVKVGFGKYPILNAMAYGSVLDKRIAVIAKDINEIPKDELKGILTHELAHTKGKHTFILTFITSIYLIIRMFLGIPATFYDYTFGNPQIPNIFGKEIKIPYEKIELIEFEYKTGLIQLKSETSLSSRLGFRILKKFKPDRIIIA